MSLRTMRCSFCKRAASEVEMLVAGPRRVFSPVYICDRCALESVAIMQRAAPGDTSETPSAQP